MFFFSFLAVFPLPESYQNDPKFHFNTLLRSDTQKSSKNVENTTVFWSRCETVFGPPPAKADIATAILTNVIEHLVLLLPPNKHAFTAKAVWADYRLGFFHMPWSEDVRGIENNLANGVAALGVPKTAIDWLLATHVLLVGMCQK